MDKITIKTGANITKILQSTVDIPQAFTELVKNAIQNNATRCEIELKENSVVITDDGIGFSEIKGEDGMNSFDRYFVFGNSYDQTEGQGVRLGHMGIGGKIANDKLSHEKNIHWTIETKNPQQKCFFVEYKPDPDFEFLDDYQPTIEELPFENSSIASETGTKIRIASLKSEIQENGWNETEIRDELRSFFGLLVNELNKNDKPFDLILNEESLNFSYKLPGSNIPEISKTFEFDLYGEKKTAEVKFNMSLVLNKDLLKDYHLKGLQIVSDVKICPFTLSDSFLYYKTLDNILDQDAFAIVDSDRVFSVFPRLIGSISCKELSTILDSTGMPAKDLSHHFLREDHPITTPFYECVYEVILNWLAEYVLKLDESKVGILDALALEISDLIIDEFDDEIAELITYQDGEVEVDEHSSGREFKSSVQSVIKNELEFELEKSQNQPPKRPPNWKDKQNKKIPKKRILPYIILDLGETESDVICKLDTTTKFRVLINSGNIKFKSLQNNPNAILITLHICECLIREALLFQNPNYTHLDLDKRITKFYNSKYEDLLKKMREKLAE